jgi:hypothetical protein
MDNYTTVYGVGLLDDIHNYFPDLLYNTGRFQNITHVFHYVRNQMNTRFNLFSYGASLHNAAPPAAAYAEPSTPTPIFRRRATAQNETVQAANFLLGLMQLGTEGDMGIQLPGRFAQTPDIWASFNDPVVVRPTAQAIAAGTENIEGSTLAENTVCAICQDIISNTDPARRLRACGHVYHRVCIDQWLLRSVHCPTCRHDIRLPAPAAAAAVVTPLPSPIVPTVTEPTYASYYDVA